MDEEKILTENEKAAAAPESSEEVKRTPEEEAAAANEALRQMEEISQAEMSKFTSGLGIPGL